MKKKKETLKIWFEKTEYMVIHEGVVVTDREPCYPTSATINYDHLVDLIQVVFTYRPSSDQASGFT